MQKNPDFFSFRHETIGIFSSNFTKVYCYNNMVALFIFCISSSKYSLYNLETEMKKTNKKQTNKTKTKHIAPPSTHHHLQIKWSFLKVSH